jgi:hypothetical protein
MKLNAKLVLTLTVLLGAISFATAQTWTPITNQPTTFLPGVMLQLRDGRVLMHDEGGTVAADWWVLTPDAYGSYVNGTWSYGGALPTGYQPLYFGSQVFLDGKTVVVEGGEYNLAVDQVNGVWTNLGARLTYSGNSFTWVANSPPSGWTKIGDAQSVLLADGRYMQANCCSAQNAIYTGPNTWTATGNVKQSSNDESAFTLLTNGKVLTVDTKRASSCNNTRTGSELYDPTTGVWSCAPNTPVQLYNARDEELGAAVLMYNNKVLQFGGNVVATALYDVTGNTWASGPTPPNGLDQADGPAALEPNGKVLAMLSPGLFNAGCEFMEYDPNSNSLAFTANPANCPAVDSSYYGHLMIVPTGEIMFTDFSNIVEVYKPAAGVVATAQPTILASTTSLKIGSVNNILYGKQLNGLSENNAYGDDYQGATNYPLVRLTSPSTGKVYYALTHDDSTHSIAPGTVMYTKFDLPANIPAGTYSLVAVANGIASNAIVVGVH